MPSISELGSYMFRWTKQRSLDVILFCKKCTIISIAIVVFFLCIPSFCSVFISLMQSYSAISISCDLLSHLGLFSWTWSNNPSSSKVASSNCHKIEKTNSTRATPGSHTLWLYTCESWRTLSIDSIILWNHWISSVYKYTRNLSHQQKERDRKKKIYKQTKKWRSHLRAGFCSLYNKMFLHVYSQLGLLQACDLLMTSIKASNYHKLTSNRMNI